MKKIKFSIVIECDTVKETKRLSREIFRGMKKGKIMKSKKEYDRKKGKKVEV